MRAGIFAAGFGTRLQPVSPATPKALTTVGGRALIDWVLADLDDAGVRETIVIVNAAAESVRDHVETAPPRCPLRWIVETTPSSMHSFLRVVEHLAAEGDEGPFLLSTVDTIAPAGTFREFLDRSRGVPSSDVVLGVTSLGEDQNPLLVDLAAANGSPGGRLRALGRGPYATAGYYLVASSVLREAAAAREAGLPALRAFFSHLFARGYRLHGVVMPASIDVDRPEDVAAAERLLEARPS